MVLHLVYSLFPSHETAEAAVSFLLEKRLIACANLFPGLTSWFRWEGEVTQTREVALLCKTVPELVEKVFEELKALHPYTCPCIVGVAPATVQPEFAEWVREVCAVNKA